MLDHRIQHVPKQALLKPQSHVQNEKTETKRSFKETLDKATDELKISKHAKSRLNERDIAISDEKWAKIESSIKDADKKGITDSLVITEDSALLISVKNKTVVTAMDRSEAQSRVFTNINGTILLD
ncbi:flagellar operon protein [Pelagirhabdus alkalitolerans]|uniref:Flagellar operon protein n=1 Tax=Pelagirhabdus alkalitolerans TaxID=1612202 RepID=A0A1G6H3G1_9BACI|nr:TIGR02530 family flagellar biosynthesis protein [Pelagirhabdus alkalitolerans]SDB88693.1 flagellar operon protein [Pelagirhabdus alkalitolerans]